MLFQAGGRNRRYKFQGWAGLQPASRDKPGETEAEEVQGIAIREQDI